MSDELRRARDYGRAACRRKYRLCNVICECGYAPATERHHQDGDTTNNALSNVRLLCDACHTAQHTGDRWHADRAANRWVRA
jgi:hypothetical protein